MADMNTANTGLVALTAAAPAAGPWKLHTTLNRLKAAGACRERYAHLIAALGGLGYDHDAPINLLEILRHNGPDDCAWSCCATVEDSAQALAEYKRVKAQAWAEYKRVKAQALAQILAPEVA